MNILLLFLFCVKTAPIEDNGKELEENTLENDVEEKSIAGLIDNLNPFNNNNAGQPPDKNKDNEQTSNNPLGAVQNFFNGTNPFQQLFSSQSGTDNVLDNIKVFMVASQGMVMPASAILGGFQNLMQNLGNMGNLAQGAQNLLPTLPSVGK